MLPGKNALAGAKDAERIKLCLAGHEPIPSSAEVLSPMPLRGVVRQVLLSSDAATGGIVRQSKVAVEEVTETMPGAGGRVGRLEHPNDVYHLLHRFAGVRQHN